MERGVIDTDTLAGGIDLGLTLESGQTYRWRRSDGGQYGTPHSQPPWYETVIPTDTGVEVLRVSQTDGHLEWESTTDDAASVLRTTLRLNDDLPGIVDQAPADPLLDEAYRRHAGMRLVSDPPFPTLISFIASAQMRVERIHATIQGLMERYGTAITVENRTYHAFPTPAQLAATSETALRECGLGYRSPYVLETARMVADGEAHPREAGDLDYEEARAFLTRFHGVGPKVADCVCLFSLGFDDAVPLDVWIQRAIDEYYPACSRDSYEATSRAIREYFGGHAGYTQTYVFHHLRTA